MTKAEIILQEYISKRNKYNLLLIEIDDITLELVDRLNFPYVTCSTLSDMPHSQTNKFNSATEILALLEGKISEGIAKEIISQGKELERFQNRIISILQESEHFILCKKYFEVDISGKPYSWAQIAGMYTKRFNLDYTDRQTIRNRVKYVIMPKLEKILL